VGLNFSFESFFEVEFGKPRGNELKKDGTYGTDRTDGA
jgi:hypothetical protein